MKPKVISSDTLPAALSRHSIGLAAVVLGVAVILVFGDVMIAGSSKVLSRAGGDVYLAELARRTFNFGQLTHGNFALWCPTLFCGYPSFGGMQTQLVYPLSFPFLLLSPEQAINWSFILHTYLGAMFMYLWLGRQSLHRYACLAGALMFAFCGPFYLRIYAGHLTPHNTIAWIPLVLLAIDGILVTPTLGWLLLGAGAVSLQLLAGYPQVTFYTGIAAGLYALARIHEAPRPWKSLALLALLNVFVLALTCVQWAAGLAMADECVRKGGVPYEFAASLSLPPENWLTLIRPGIFGDLQHAPYWGRWYIWEMCLFFGTIGLFFSAVGLFHAKRRLVLSVGGIALALGVLAMGAYSPHFRFFYDHVPGFNVFRSNSKFGILAVVFLIFLSAHGLDILCRGASNKLAAGMFFGSLAACGAATLLIGAVELCSTSQFQRIIKASLNSGETFFTDPQKAFALPAAVEAAANFTAGELAVAWCFLAALSVVVGLNWRRPHLRPQLAPVVLGLIGVELLLFAWSMHASFSPDLIRSRLTKAVLQETRADGSIANRPISDLDLFRQQNLVDGRTLSLDTLNLTPFLTGVDDMWGYGSDSVVRRYAEFLAFTQGSDPDAVTGYQSFTQIHPRFDMLRCKYILTAQPDGSLLVTPAPVPTSLPRFLLIRDWRVTPERDAVFEQISRTDFDPRQTVLLQRQPRGWSAPESKPAADASGTIRILRESTDWQEIEVTLDKPAILLETDLYTPNWHVAALTGSSQTDYELIPANYLLRGIPLEAGTHRLRIEYRPAAFVVGKWVSLVALAAWLALAVRWDVRRRKSTPANH